MNSLANDIVNENKTNQRAPPQFDMHAPFEYNI